MKRRIWSIEELSHILLATNEANATADALLYSGNLSPESTAIVQAYREGFRAALSSVALAVGIPICAESPRTQEMARNLDTPIIEILPAD